MPPPTKSTYGSLPFTYLTDKKPQKSPHEVKSHTDSSTGKPLVSPQDSIKEDDEVFKDGGDKFSYENVSTSPRDRYPPDGATQDPAKQDNDSGYRMYNSNTELSKAGSRKPAAGLPRTREPDPDYDSNSFRRPATYYPQPYEQLQAPKTFGSTGDIGQPKSQISQMPILSENNPSEQSLAGINNPAYLSATDVADVNIAQPQSPSSPSSFKSRPLTDASEIQMSLRDSKSHSRSDEEEKSGKSCCCVAIAVVVTAILCIGIGFVIGWFLYPMFGASTEAMATTTMAIVSDSQTTQAITTPTTTTTQTPTTTSAAAAAAVTSTTTATTAAQTTSLLLTTLIEAATTTQAPQEIASTTVALEETTTNSV